MAYVKDNETALLGVNDASIKNGCGTHAWILTTGEMEHMSDPCMKLEGSGPVDGDPYTMSSARGELQGQTALAIVTSTLLKEHDAQNAPVSFYTDNMGIQKSCKNPKIHRVGHHRNANMDLQLEHATWTKNMCITHDWVKGHQDKDAQWDTIEDLKQLKLNSAATLNVYCDRKASKAYQHSTTISNCDVLPSEKWALFSMYPERRKITGKLNEGVLQTIHSEEIQAYIAKKHNITSDKLSHIDTISLKNCLKALRPHNRAMMVKLIHQWIPTNAFLFKQRRTDSPLCPRCNVQTEDSPHIFKCHDSQAATK
jgi:hypothetical protein